MEGSSVPSFFRLLRPDGSRCWAEFDFFGLCGNHEREQGILQLRRGVPLGKHGRKLKSLGFPVRYEELAGYRDRTFFDPDLPIEILLPERQVMAWYPLHLAQTQIEAGKHPLGEI